LLCVKKGCKITTEICKQCEANQGILNKQLEKHPSTFIFGDIHYAMTLDEMIQKIKLKLMAILKENNIITKKEFKKIKDKYHDCPFTKITRIWGAKYLKKKIDDSEYLQKKYDVPNYKIVVENLSDIKVLLDFYNPQFPSYHFVPENAAIYFEKIEKGDQHPKSGFFDSNIKNDLLPLGFIDYGHNNIILGYKKENKETIKYYIVDTERKSFKIPVEDHNLYGFIEYMSAKFKYCNNIGLTHEISINLME